MFNHLFRIRLILAVLISQQANLHAEDRTLCKPIPTCQCDSIAANTSSSENARSRSVPVPFQPSQATTPAPGPIERQVSVLPTGDLWVTANPLTRFGVWCLAILWLPWSVARLIKLILKSDSFTLQTLLGTTWLAGLVASGWIVWGRDLLPTAFAIFMMPPLTLMTLYFVLVCDSLRLVQ